MSILVNDAYWIKFHLLQNIVFPGGSTMFKDFHRRLQREIKKIVGARVHASEAKFSNEVKVSIINLTDNFQ